MAPTADEKPTETATADDQAPTVITPTNNEKPAGKKEDTLVVKENDTPVKKGKKAITAEKSKPKKQVQKYDPAKHANHRDFAENLSKSKVNGASYLAALFHWGHEKKFSLTTLKKFHAWENETGEQRTAVAGWRKIAAGLGLRPAGYKEEEINKNPLLVLESSKAYPGQHYELMKDRQKRKFGDETDDEKTPAKKKQATKQSNKRKPRTKAAAKPASKDNVKDRSDAGGPSNVNSTGNSASIDSENSDSDVKSDEVDDQADDEVEEEDEEDIDEDGVARDEKHDQVAKLLDSTETQNLIIDSWLSSCSRDMAFLVPDLNTGIFARRPFLMSIRKT